MVCVCIGHGILSVDVTGVSKSLHVVSVCDAAASPASLSDSLMASSCECMCMWAVSAYSSHIEASHLIELKFLDSSFSSLSSYWN